jgi:hypothetical protein
MNWKLSTRLILLFVILGLIPFSIIGIYSYWNSRVALQQNITERLSFVRENKKEQIESYFEMIRRQVITFSEDRMVIEAMREFNQAFATVEEELNVEYEVKASEYEEVLKKRYVHQQQNTMGAPDNAVDLWWPKSKTTRILQHYYISSNPYQVGDKHKLDCSKDNSTYSSVHSKFHPVIRSFLEKFGYYDVFLVGIDGQVVYTVYKELDFATNLVNGPYGHTNLASVYKAARESNKKDSTHFADFELYEPSYNRAASFIASPIFEHNQMIGVLIFQMPLDEINRIMTNDGNWIKVGQGKSGESFLIGPDYIFRSNSRFLLEDTAQFIRDIKQVGVSEEKIIPIEANKTVVGYLDFKSEHIGKALAGNMDIVKDVDYRGQPVILSYTPLEFFGTVWALVSVMSQEEAFAVLDQLKNAMWILGLFIVVSVITLGWWFARSISKPLNNTINTLSTSSAEIAATVTEQERIANQQAASVNETNTTMEELGASSRQTAEQAQAAAYSTEMVLSLTQDGANKVNEMLQGMASLKGKVGAIAQQILHLSEQTSQIGSITAMVTDFANETKMLAMNAAVEAVRAGEHGKGFSVLSVEIRKLADESKRSADRINALVVDVQKATNATVMATEEGTKTVDAGIELTQSTAATFDSVAAAVGSASESAQQISLNVAQQAEAVKQVVEAMNALKISSKESASGIAQTKVGIQTLNEAAQQLKSMV